MKLMYHRKGDYLFPNLVIEEQPEIVIGKYGLLRKAFLKKHRPNLYQCMLATGELSYHLAEIDQCANERWEALTSQMARVEGATEALKESDPIAWIQLMNSIQNRAEEIIQSELVYC